MLFCLVDAAPDVVLIYSVAAVDLAVSLDHLADDEPLLLQGGKCPVHGDPADLQALADLAAGVCNIAVVYPSLGVKIDHSEELVGGAAQAKAGDELGDVVPVVIRAEMAECKLLAFMVNLHDFSPFFELLVCGLIALSGADGRRRICCFSLVLQSLVCICWDLIYNKNIVIF